MKISVPEQSMASVAGIAILLLIMVVLRFSFMVVNWGTFSRFEALDLAISFLNGVRFDLHIILVLTGLFFLSAHLPGSWKKKKSFAGKMLLTPVNPLVSP